jgi:hypothetical protein
MNRTTALLVEAGIIPKNTLQQLVNWRLVPEGLEQSHGKRLVGPETDTPARTQFITDLTLALTRDLAEIRETEFDKVGEHQKVSIIYDGGSLSLEVFVDRLGRVILPHRDFDGIVLSVSLPDGTTPRPVVRSESRFQGDRPVSQVLYLENQGVDYDAS